MGAFELLLCIGLVLVSGFLSSTEVALFSLSRFQLRYIRENFRASYRYIRRLLNDPSGVLISILVMNEIVNVSISSIVTQTVAVQLDEVHWFWQIFGGVLVTSPVIILLCEVTPKTAASQINQLIATLTAKPMTWIYQGLFPIRWIAARVLTFFSTKTSRGPTPVPSLKHMRLKEDDFLILLEEGQREGMIHQDEIDLIRNIFELDDTPVSQITTPLSNLYTVSSQSKLSEIIPVLQKKRYSRIPVFHQNRNNIVGILYAKDVIFARMKNDHIHQTVGEIMREPVFVHETTHLKTVFRRLRENQIHMAIVQKNPQEASGVVTLGDILEDIFEGLIDEEESEGSPS